MITTTDFFTTSLNSFVILNNVSDTIIDELSDLRQVTFDFYNNTEAYWLERKLEAISNVKRYVKHGLATQTDVEQIEQFIGQL